MHSLNGCEQCLLDCCVLPPQDDVMLRALRFLDTILQRDQPQKASTRTRCVATSPGDRAASGCDCAVSSNRTASLCCVS
jgi:hypothetical protein